MTQRSPKSSSQAGDLQAQFQQYLRERKMRCTVERTAIINCIKTMKPHFTVEQLYNTIEERGFHVSQATVYNTIEILCDAGMLRKHQFGSHTASYETTGKNHFHLICTDCGKIREVQDPNFAALLQAKRFSSFTPQYFSASVFGICSNCARKRKKRLKESDDKTK